MVDHNPPTQLLRVLHQILFLLNFRSFFSSTKLQEGGELWKTEMIFTELQKVIFVMIGKSTPWPDLIGRNTNFPATKWIWREGGRGGSGSRSRSWLGSGSGSRQGAGRQERWWYSPSSLRSWVLGRPPLDGLVLLMDEHGWCKIENGSVSHILSKEHFTKMSRTNIMNQTHHKNFYLKLAARI